MSTAVMAKRHTAVDSLDFFPTPPWATRCLFHHVLGLENLPQSVWEPAAGEGHMVEVLREFSPLVFASDVHDYGKGYEIGTFVGEGADKAMCPFKPEYTITNPPFNKAGEFLERALDESSHGVAMLLRTAWLEGGERHRSIFSKMPPACVAVFSERVPMVAGKWDPDASSATSYSWFVWDKQVKTKRTSLLWVPPGRANFLTMAKDELMATRNTTEAPLLDLMNA